MFKSVLVANRGEIACRVFRTARRMGVRTVAVYSEADAAGLHVREADEAVFIGAAPARESYLDPVRVLAAARQAGAEAIHPGYGFLSENAEFAEAVTAAGLVWIGPPPEAIRAMGLKDAAKTLMIQAGVPVTPGYQGEDQTDATLTAEADRIGYPVLIKAVAGGGGKGMKRVDRAEDFADGLASARREGKAAFGDDRVLIESYITRPRHIEVQVFGDSHGEVVHLHERDCSLQRRHQKVIEEAPAPGMDAATREAVTSAAVRAARAVGYRGAGTIEFIADASEGLKPDRIWFMEMNTRLQVEHPVTEAVTGVDLVEWQFRIAAGEPLPLRQDQIPLNGWAMEARLYAEDPLNGFLPSIGRLQHFRLPSGVRVDAGVAEGGEVSQYYDPMIAKLIAHAPTRQAAASELAQATAQVEVWPVKTNAGFLVRCLEHPRFREGDVDTGFIAAEEVGLMTPEAEAAAADALAFLAAQSSAPDLPADPFDPVRGLPGFRAGAPAHTGRPVYLNGDRVSGDLERAVSSGSNFLAAARDQGVMFRRGDVFDVRIFPVAGGGAGPASDGGLRAPMPGKIVAIPAASGDPVVKGAPIVVLEAMKMEHALVAPFNGSVESIAVAVGEQVGEGMVLAIVRAEGEA